MWLGIDTGGTFTDFVLYDGKNIRVHKVLSTPDDPVRAITQGLRELQIDLDSLSIVHGSTVATNAVLERKGVTTAYITNRGFADVLTIGRQARKQLYNLQPDNSPPPVPREFCLEMDARIGAEGNEISTLTKNDIETLLIRLRELKPQAVAINLLFSFIDSRHEREIESALQGGYFVSRSSSILPTVKEYERGIATWLNAYVGPLMQNYLTRLEQQTRPASIAIMQSTGGTTSCENAAHRGVDLLLSGPAGGLAAARYIANTTPYKRLLTFDMGGTSTDVSLLDGEIRFTDEGQIAGFPVAVPMVDIHTIGAGGGSIAYVDAGGMLQVGPQSAGAQPGPACYNRGGTQPTVTDANLLLGRLKEESFVGGQMRLSRERAHAAIEPIADQLGLSVLETAEGVIRIANEHMARALRVISVERGYDPRQFTLMCFGGAGGLHVCALASAIGIKQAIVPRFPGVLCAFGMLCAPRRQEFTRAIVKTWPELNDADLVAPFAELEREAITALTEQGLAEKDIAIERRADVRYHGQSYTLQLKWNSLANTLADFHVTHQRRIGHNLDEITELVNIRVSATGPEPAFFIGDAPVSTVAEAEWITLAGNETKARVFPRSGLPVGWKDRGPLLITEATSTIFVERGWQIAVDPKGHLLLTCEIE